MHTLSFSLYFLFACWSQFKVIAIIAEGIPENKTKRLIKKAHSQGVSIIGPATVSAFCSINVRSMYVRICHTLEVHGYTCTNLALPTSHITQVVYSSHEREFTSNTCILGNHSYCSTCILGDHPLAIVHILQL